MRLFIVLVLTATAGSYSWGMRGRIIGNQRGAYLPGALLGMLISLFTCGGVFRELFPVFASVGAFAMSHGGTQTYGETLSFVLKSDADGPYKNKEKKGYIAVFIKGADWFGLCTFYLAFTVQFLNGHYKDIVLIVIMLVSPIIQALGRYIFNAPYDKEQKIYPKIYFSITRREEWGGNILLWSFLTLLSVLLNDWYTFGASCFGFIFGGIGFSFGLFIFAKNSKNNGMIIFRFLNNKNLVGNWKMMECIFGAVAFLGSIIYFIFAPFNYSGLINYNNSQLASKPFVSVILLIFTFIIGVISEPVGVLLNTKGKSFVSEFSFEVFGRFLMTFIPTLIVIFGSPACAELSSLLYIAYFTAEKVGLEWFKKYESKKKILIVSFVTFSLTIIHYIINGASITFILTVYTILHVIPSLLYSFNTKYEKKRKEEGKSIMQMYGADLLIEPHFILESLVLLLIPYLSTIN